MSVEPKIVAAITGAISLYLQAEREELIAVRPEEAKPEVAAAASVRIAHMPSLWALSGRQAAMEMRRMWQMRLVR